VYNAQSTGSFETDFGGSGLFQNIVVAVSHPSTKQVVFTVDGGIGDVWASVVGATSSTGNISVTTSTRAFDKARVTVSANGSTSATMTKIYLGAF
jgi:hypothetical protein